MAVHNQCVSRVVVEMHPSIYHTHTPRFTGGYFTLTFGRTNVRSRAPRDSLLLPVSFQSSGALASAGIDCNLPLPLPHGGERGRYCPQKGNPENGKRWRLHEPYITHCGRFECIFIVCLCLLFLTTGGRETMLHNPTPAKLWRIESGTLELPTVRGPLIPDRAGADTIDFPLGRWNLKLMKLYLPWKIAKLQKKHCSDNSCFHIFFPHGDGWKS